MPPGPGRQRFGFHHNQAFNALRWLYRNALHVKDIDFEQSQIKVSSSKGEKDRLTRLPVSLVEPLKAQIASVQQQRARDLANSFGSVEPPFALVRKYPNADKELA